LNKEEDEIGKAKKYTVLTGKKTVDLLKVGDSTGTNLLNGRYKDNDSLIKVNIEINRSVNW